MPVFAYKGVDGHGKSVAGSRDADSPKTLRAQMRREGVLVTDVSVARAGKSAVAGAGSGLGREVHLGKLFERVKKNDVAAFTRQLSTLLKAGIPLTEALGALFEQVEQERLKTILGEVRERVNAGSSLADALGRHPKVFEPVFQSMVRAGETAGNLDAVLARLADFMESQVKLRSKVMSAMIYPIVMVVLGTVLMAVLMIAVIPQISTIFEDAEQALPWNTVALIWFSSVLGRYWYLWIGGAVFGGWGLMRWSRSASGRPVWDRFKLKLPVAGDLLRRVAIARFTRTLGTMLASGVPLLRALEIAKETLGNAVLSKVIEGAREQIQQGESIALTLKRSGEFPSIVTHMIAVGERAGQLEQMLGNVAEAYEGEVDMQLGRLTSLLEPLMIIGMGGAVAFVVASILMPIMQMNQFVQ